MAQSDPSQSGEFFRMKVFRSAMLSAIGVLFAATAQAQTTQAFGAGTAVSFVQGSASFESQSALFDNPYLEDGMSFTRTNMTFNNNNCGFAGCPGHIGFTGFSGNYMYGTGTGGYFDIFAPTGQRFSGLEFVLGTGWFSSSLTVQWQAYLNGNLVGSGATAGQAGDVIAFSDATGFDDLRYTDDGSGGMSTAAFDEVRAGYVSVTATPEPATFALMATGPRTGWRHRRSP